MQDHVKATLIRNSGTLLWGLVLGAGGAYGVATGHAIAWFTILLAAFFFGIAGRRIRDDVREPQTSSAAATSEPQA